MKFIPFFSFFFLSLFMYNKNADKDSDPIPCHPFLNIMLGGRLMSPLAAAAPDPSM